MLLLIIQITNPYSVFKFTPPIIPVVSVIKSPVFTVKSVADRSKVPFLMSWFPLPIPINLDTSTADPSGVSLSANQEILFSTIPNVFKQILSIQFLRIHDVCPLNDIQMGLIRNLFKGFIIMCFNLAFNIIYIMIIKNSIYHDNQTFWMIEKLIRPEKKFSLSQIHLKCLILTSV